MIESNFVAGRQTLVPGQPLVYGQSNTDGCINWATMEAVLELLAEGALRATDLARIALKAVTHVIHVGGSPGRSF